MKSSKKLLMVILMLSMLVASLTACGAEEKETDSDIKPTTPPSADNGDALEGEQEDDVEEVVEPRDLNGINIVVGGWWSTGDEEPADQKEEDTIAYRERLQEDHNFTLTQTNLGGWAEYQEIFITSTMSGDPAADIFIMDQAFCPEPIKQGLMFPLSDLPSFNPNHEAWNKSVMDMYTQKEKIFAFSEERDTPGLGVFFNKRLFEEAGYDGDYLYDLQASGEWTWEKYRELAKELTVDTNNDGVTDTYGVTTWQREVVKAAVFSNGVDYVKFNEDTGRYENNQMHDDFIAAIQLGVDMYAEGYIMPVPEDSEYTYFVDVFAAGQAAMCPTEWYRNSSFQDMDDDWGFVFFPKGSSDTATMQTMYVGNVRVMPAGMNAERADDVMFAYEQWISTVPGYEDDEVLTFYYSQTRDARAVDETIKPMLEGQGIRSLVYMVPGLSFKHGANEDGDGLGDISAVEIAEAASAIYDGIIASFYED